ncbi:MAG TPA: hypothetical protein VL326_33030 [Kofleriaceae bacterium]|nr:hypothetical protein [Kofleriaceae bacterium]
MRVHVAAAVLVAAVCGGGARARADERLDLQLPDLPLWETAFHLDRDTPYDERTQHGVNEWISAGATRADDGGTYDPQTGRTGSDARAAFGGSAGIAMGRQGEQLIGLWRSELYGLSGRGLRGRHRGLLEGRTRYSDDLGLDVTIAGSFEHGDARGLGPVRLGPSERATGDLSSESYVRIGSKKGDFKLVALLGAGFGGTAWEATNAPTLDHEAHHDTTVAFAAAPSDGELPHGRIDIVRVRVEGQTVTFRPNAIPIDPSKPMGPGNGAADVRTIDVMVGAANLTFNIDHELFCILDMAMGGSWIESESAAADIHGSVPTIHDSVFKMRMASAVKWKPSNDDATRGIGINISRGGTTSPDASRILGEWRLELANSMDTKDFVVEARGGVSWLRPFVGGTMEDRNIVRYGLELEAFMKVYGGVEAGIYHASSFEPRVTGDPWATPRRWAVESGALVRMRH